ncbi:potassium transporter TrkA [Rhizocola hellebori]|uniref:Potassium transporter TrkA n=1 Tax=Rhizocola hellebori TaxID=1392758 RepID=A0A8J3VMB2_9ACTN|nr:NAD-binding protein [Rhizocola hellebori]GIH11472.1 potassium transporter TrkA [Rhizocola hellebori]
MINGADGLAFRLADQLSRRYAGDVVVLMTQEQHRVARDFGELPRVEVVVVERVDEKALLEADVMEASALALTNQDDVANIHVGLQARDIAPNLKLVIRMYNTRLGQAIESLFTDCKVLSDSEIASPALIAVTLDEVAANPVKIGRRTLISARRDAVDARDIVCGLADTSAPGNPALLPADAATANLVLAEVRSPQTLINTVAIGQPAPKRRWRFAAGRAVIRALISRKLGITLLFVIMVLLASGIGLALSDDQIGGWDSFYLTMVNAFGGPQERGDFSRLEQVLQLLMGVAGLTLVPLVTALIVEGMVNARLAVAQGRLFQPQSDHIVLVGLGGVGTRILRLLHDRGIKVVAVDSTETARGVPLARELAVPLLIGDASRETTLRQAGVDRCKAMMTVASNDVINLEVALQGRQLNPKLRVLVRLFDDDMARRVRRTFDLKHTRSVSYVAAPAFAEAMMDREVVGIISVERRVLLLAEIVVAAGSSLDGSVISQTDEPGEARVIALTELGEPRPLWNPPGARSVKALDTLTVVCTRDGLSRLSRRNRPADVLEAGSVA